MTSTDSHSTDREAAVQATEKPSGPARALGILSLVLAIPFVATMTIRLVSYVGEVIVGYVEGFIWVFGALLPVGLVCGVLGMMAAVRRGQSGLRWAIAGTLACAIPLLVLLILGYMSSFGS
jgi:hypothetical protein